MPTEGNKAAIRRWATMVPGTDDILTGLTQGCCVAGSRSAVSIKPAPSSSPSGGASSPFAPVREKDGAMLCYACGTARTPKGVLYSHLSGCSHFRRHGAAWPPAYVPLERSAVGG
jgi:acyl-CoA synthetase (AMP-forming)/AMP-acid ligase II